ncbi:MAG: sn-glycerol-3-phosphate ABC transporter ATP-binding protein UgpC [Candidatus Sericytochromatia bacterium]|nr:sn-glycerol-3-phosphate ABC transporter ATP-binding protein UgpC [Candidatus Sericytochromatia bacterium]
MGEVKLTNIVKRYGTVEIIKSLSLHIRDGEFLVLVGGSGCGKSTTLRLIAGLETANEGTITIGDRDVTNIPPKDRDIAMVFQNYALYPHMTVYDNIAFGLKLRKYSKSEIEKKVQEAADMLDIKPYLQRKPKELSGGQRQRVALGRALVRDSQVFLMDEPLSNLDAKLRMQTRTEIKRLQQKLGITTVYVTHDQIEAMTMGDRIAVMKGGIIQQLATPAIAYEFPTNLFVAGFIGSPSMNFLQVKVSDLDSTSVKVEAPGLSLNLKRTDASSEIDAFKGKEMTFGIRPEFLALTDVDTSIPEWQSVQAWVDVVEPSGSRTFIHLSVGDKHKLVAEVDTIKVLHITSGTEIPVWLDTRHVHLFDPVSEKRILSTAKHP